MKDAIGQEIKVGDIIVHCGGSNASANLREVLRISEKMIAVETDYVYRNEKPRLVNLYPRTVINVTSNLKTVKENE